METFKLQARLIEKCNFIIIKAELALRSNLLTIKPIAMKINRHETACWSKLTYKATCFPTSRLIAVVVDLSRVYWSHFQPFIWIHSVECSRFAGKRNSHIKRPSRNDQPYPPVLSTGCGRIFIKLLKALISVKWKLVP